MRNQFFGDVRDLFKYDLITWLVQNIEGIDRFTFIPMLTADDSRGHERKTDYAEAKAGNKNEELVNLLRECVDGNRRDIREIKPYFLSRGIEAVIYGEESLFTHGKRAEYFRGIGDSLLRRSLVFLDPDNGLEVKNSNKRHLLYEELKIYMTAWTAVPSSWSISTFLVRITMNTSGEGAGSCTS